MNQKLFAIGQLAAAIAIVGLIAHVGLRTTSIAYAHSDSDPMEVQSDDERYAQGYDRYTFRLNDLGDDRHLVEVISVDEAHLGDIIIDTGVEQWLLFDSVTDWGSAQLDFDFSAGSTVYVDLNGEPAGEMTNLGGGSYRVDYCGVIDWVAIVSPEPLDPLRLLLDVLDDLNFQSEVLDGLGQADIAPAVGAFAFKVGCGGYSYEVDEISECLYHVEVYGCCDEHVGDVIVDVCTENWMSFEGTCLAAR